MYVLQLERTHKPRGHHGREVLENDQGKQRVGRRLKSQARGMTF